MRRNHDVCEGMSVIATVNIKDKNIFNTMEFKIDEIDTDTNKLSNGKSDKLSMV